MMNTTPNILRILIAALLFSWLSGCATANGSLQTNHHVAEPTQEDFNKDRAAILAMAGEYSIDFQFRETVALQSGYKLTDPYLSKATEIVEVIEDTGRRIDMQHILLIGNGRVVKHWRQTWVYEPTMIYEFKGHNTWAPRQVSPQERKGAWAQWVYQVDDSPRYAGVGHWTHSANLTSWESDTWRPLPRREYTKRSDYHVLVARNRHTLTPTGWVHEQDNHKLILGEKEKPYISREVGLNVYTKVKDVDFSSVRDYWAATKSYWSDVRTAWSQLMNGQRTLKLKDSWKDKKLFLYLFELANEAQTQKSDSETLRKKLQEVLDGFVVDVETAADTGEGSNSY